MKKGFSIVEISVVLVIVGIIAGGILISQSLIGSARTNAIIKEYQQYRSLASQFKLEMGYLPGDMPNAKSVFGTSCPDLNTYCNGNGDGIVGDTQPEYLGESCRFWQHLAIAKYIDGKDLTFGDYRVTGECQTTITPVSRYNEKAYWGIGRGATDTGDGPFMYTKANTTYFYLRKNGGIDFSLGPCTGGCAIIKPADALSVDTKIDDSLPHTGKVMGGHTNARFFSAPEYDPNYSFCYYHADPGGPSAGDLSTWAYYTNYKRSDNGCTIAIEAQF